LGWVILALLVSLAFGAGTYAAVPVVARLFRQEPVLQSVEQADFVQEVALSQTVGEITITLERVYAGADRVTVGFTLQGPDNRRYDPHQLTLTDAEGTVLPFIHGLGVAGHSDILDVSLPPGEGAYVYAFDASALGGMPETLDLHLVIDVEELVLPPAAATSPPTPTGSPAEPPEPMVVELQPLPVGAVVGPFTFDVSVGAGRGETP